MTRLISTCTRAIVAAKMAVRVPTTATSVSADPAAVKSGVDRATR